MSTAEQRLIDAAQEIETICKKYNVELSPKYDEGIAVILSAYDETPDKNQSGFEVEITT